MRNRFNSTGRKRIPYNVISFTVSRDASQHPVWFDADLSGITKLGLPAHGRVVVEPFIRSSAMRFEFGTVGAILPPLDRRLDALDRNAGDVRFRVKVVDHTAGVVGRLLAAADDIPPENSSADNGDGRQALLPVKTVPLGELIWDIEISAGSRPFLCLNSSVPGLREALVTNPLLQGAILPTALGRVIRELLNDAEGEMPPWADDWRRFLQFELGLENPSELDDDDDDGDAKEEYVNEAIKAFVNKYRYATRAAPADDAMETPHD